MIFFDIIHGYQPFQEPYFKYDWVEKNLKEAFLPVSIALARGTVRRGLQVQGWTLDEWYYSSEAIQSLAGLTVKNLRKAVELGHAELGFSGYTHPILPLLNRELIVAQLSLDYESVKTHLGQPTWFWPPEGAVGRELLEILCDKYPDIIVVVPDTSLGRTNYSGFLKIKHNEGRMQRAIVCNTLLKDIMMNSTCYPQKPGYFEANIDWTFVQDMVFDGEKFKQVLDHTPGELHILARDWENEGSRKGLVEIGGGGCELKGLVELNAEFKLPTEGDWEEAEILDLEHVQEASWEVDAPHDDPFMYWWPREGGNHWNRLTPVQKAWSKKWMGFLKEFNDDFKIWADACGGIENVLGKPNLREDVRRLLPGLMSCVPWHFLTKELWKPDPGFSEDAWDKIVDPARARLKELLEGVSH